MIKIKYVISNNKKLHIFKDGEKVRKIHVSLGEEKLPKGSIIVDILNNYKRPYKTYTLTTKRKGKTYENPVIVWKISEKEAEDLKILTIRKISSSNDVVEKSFEIDETDRLFEDLIDYEDAPTRKVNIKDAHIIDKDFYENAYKMSKLLDFESFPDLGISVFWNELFVKYKSYLLTVTKFNENNKIDYILTWYKTKFMLKLKDENALRPFWLNEKVIFPGEIHITKKGEKIAMPPNNEKIIKVKGDKQIEWRKHIIRTERKEDKMSIYLKETFLTSITQGECRKVMRDLILCWD